MEIAIVGAGAAGLNAARHVAHTYNCIPTVFEKNSSFGGVWVYNPNTGIDQRGEKIQSSMYRDLRTNLPKDVMMFPDVPYKESLNESFVHHTEVLDYLNEFVDKFEIKKYIHFNTKVVSIKPIYPDPADKEEISENGNGMEVHENGNCSEAQKNGDGVEAHENGNGIEAHENGNVIEAHKNGNEIETHKNGNLIKAHENGNGISTAENHPRNGGENGVQTKNGAKTNGKEAEKNMKNKLNSNKKWKIEYLCLETKTSHFKYFDGVMICVGAYTTPHYPQIPGLEQFTGRVMHSNDYRYPDPFRGDSVVILGASYSGADIGLELVPQAEKIYLSHNNPKLTSALPDNMIQIRKIL
ncbi:flavin-containing monooxygenase FMO GS-OX2 [Eurytemora carolleeae]|uniref:flavin-containing monooxygenase FMO GS-OX2 n=1 Tax=Eurytemora carolleeae TaxID=1294199 RepID=UPI000C75B4C6|nr:flavin-containing monooxygenase FMO GS-OX2 [Eurytemora carolleeae]|eukprot:XP_023348013.1 flavin-containing monooxygenase FMO GS-OX2-like [Eurytemora affinis]